MRKGLCTIAVVLASLALSGPALAVCGAPGTFFYSSAYRYSGRTPDNGYVTMRQQTAALTGSNGHVLTMISISDGNDCYNVGCTMEETGIAYGWACGVNGNPGGLWAIMSWNNGGKETCNNPGFGVASLGPIAAGSSHTFGFSRNTSTDRFINYFDGTGSEAGFRINTPRTEQIFEEVAPYNNCGNGQGLVTRFRPVATDTGFVQTWDDKSASAAWSDPVGSMFYKSGAYLTVN